MEVIKAVQQQLYAQLKKIVNHSNVQSQTDKRNQKSVKQPQVMFEGLKTMIQKFCEYFGKLKYCRKNLNSSQTDAP